MPDLPQQNTIVQYLADGISTTYKVPYYVPVETDGTPDIDVYTQLSTALPIPANDINIWNVNYVYTPNFDFTTGGIVTFLSGSIPPNGYVVTIARNVSASLNVEFSNATTFSGFTLDFALDKLLLITQQNKSFILERNLSYIVNTYLPESTIEANTNIPVLMPGQVWYGSANGVIAATLEQSADTSTLRSELANNAPVTNGANLVGYYDTVNNDATNVAAQLTYLTGVAEGVVPPGTLLDFAGASAPTGYLLCDGTSYPTASYPALFAAISYVWGGSGANFNVPNLQGYVTAGSGGTLPPLTNTVGSTGGASTITMTAANIAQHTHTLTAPAGGVTTGGAFSNTKNTSQNYSFTTNSGDSPISASPTPMTIVQPTAIVLKIIKI